VGIRWSTTARRDAAAIAQYISIDNPAAARKIIRKIQTQITVLSEYPYAGRIGQKLGTRELVISGAPYIVIYSLGQSNVLIEHLLHTARQWPPEGE
jgi:toxin ParE1/3/4